MFWAEQTAVLERVAAGHPLPEILADVVRMIEQRGDDMLCSVLLVDDDGVVHHGAAPSLPPAYVAALDGLAIGPAMGSCGTAAYRKQRVVVEDIATHPYWESFRAASDVFGLRACWSTPIFSADRRVIATFAMYYRVPRGPSDEELAWVDAATHLASIAINHAHAMEALRRSEAQSRNLAQIYAMSNAINEAIARDRDGVELYELACALAVERGLARLAWVGVVDPATQHIRPVAHAGVAADYVSAIDLDLTDDRMNRGPAFEALRTQRPAVSHDLARDPTVFWQDAVRDHKLGSVLVLPLRERGRATAILAIYAERTHAFGPEEVALLARLADDIALSVEAARTERALRDSEAAVRAGEQLRAMIYDCVGDVVFCLAVLGDGRYRFESVNRAFTETTGLAEASVVGRAIEDVLPPATAALLVARAAEAIAARRKVVWDEAVRFPAGTRHGAISISPVIDAAGRCSHLVGTVHDITARVEADAERREVEAKLNQSQRLQALGTLSGGIAHDFNNILAAIHGNLDMTLEDLGDSHPAREGLREVKRAAKRATELVRQVLTFSSRTEPRRELLELREVVEEVLLLLHTVLKHKAQLRTRFGLDVPRIMGDSTQLHQVMMNLITNAAHAVATADGEIAVTLDACTIGPEARPDLPELGEGRYARLTITDNGCGMAPDTLRRIFEPFFTTRGTGGGTGLGLSVVHGIVKSHDGAIAVRSEPGRGTTFELLFPAAQPVAFRPRLQPAAVETAPPRRILFVDNDEALVFLARRAFLRLGHHIAAFTHAREALREFERHPGDFDVIVTDVAMPELDGPGLARAARLISRDVKIVMISGCPRPEDLAAARELGIATVHEKPHALDDIVRIVVPMLA